MKVQITKDKQGLYLSDSGNNIRSPVFKTDIGLYHWINEQKLKRVSTQIYEMKEDN